MTKDFRTTHRINSEVGKYALGTINARGHRPGSTGGYPTLCKTEIQKILGALNVCVHHSGVLVSELPQSGLELDDALPPNKTEQHTQIFIDTNLSASSVMVC